MRSSELTDPTKQPILIVLHQATSTPGRVGQVLRERGYRLDIKRPALGDSLPHTTEAYDGVVIFGGPQSANDTDAYIKREIDFCNIPLRDETPFLGICLGAQMLAKATGGSVQAHPDGKVEIGYYDVTPTSAGAEFMSWPQKVYQWHREGFTVPCCAELLLRGEHYEEQAFRVGPSAYGIQFHPELTLAMLYRWTTRGHARMALPGARHRRDHFAGRALYDAPVKSWLSRFLGRWLDAKAGAAAPPIRDVA